VLQSGGDEGMWTFDRYQRWMEQIDDWARPTQAATARSPTEAQLTQRSSVLGPARKPSTTPSVQLKPAAAKPAPAVPPRAAAAPADEVFEVPAEDMDLAGLAELAKKIGERKP
jgi:hypothetical protein